MPILKRLHFSVLFLPVLLNSYVSGCALSNSEETLTSEKITISVDGIQRSGNPFTIANLSEGKATWTWKILSSDTEQVIEVSDQKEPVLRLPAGAYDVLVTSTGTKKITRHFRRLLTVLPPLFSEQEADEVIDLSTLQTNHILKNYQDIERPGYRIMFKGSFRGRFKIVGLRGTKEKPVHIINKGQVTFGAGNEKYPFAMEWGGSNHYILIDGKADREIPYGFSIQADSTKLGQMLFISGEFNKGFEICGVKLSGPKHIVDGGAALQLQASATPRCHAGNWNFEYLKVHHCKIDHAPSEGMYLGYFTDEPRKNGFSPYRIGQVLVYRDTIINAGWDAIQIASADEFEVHDNYVDGAGLAGKINHSSFVSWNRGNTKGWCYRNTFKNGARIASIFFGIKGESAYIYSNLFVDGNFPREMNSRYFLYSLLDNTHNDVGLFVFNNTMVTSLLPAKVATKNVKGAATMRLVYAGNAIVLNATNAEKYPEVELGYKPENNLKLTVDNVWRMQGREKDLGWQNFRPVKNSLLMRSNFNAEQHIPALKGGFYDVEGYPLKKEDGTFVYGCFSKVN